VVVMSKRLDWEQGSYRSVAVKDSTSNSGDL